MESFRARKREILGKKVKKLRQRGFIPAVLYGKGKPSIPLELEKEEFLETYHEVGESSIAQLSLDSESVPVLVSDIQRDPKTLELIHVDFYLVEMGEEIAATVPLKVVGESPAVKLGEGMLLTILSELEVECLPKDLPAEVEVDVSGLDSLDKGIKIGDLPLDFSKIKVPGHAMEDLVVKIESAEMEEVEEGVPEIPVEEIEITEERGEEEEGAEGE